MQAFFPNRQFSFCLNPYPDPTSNLHPVQYHGQRAHISCVQSLLLTLWPLAVLSGVTIYRLTLGSLQTQRQQPPTVIAAWEIEVQPPCDHSRSHPA